MKASSERRTEADLDFARAEEEAKERWTFREFLWQSRWPQLEDMVLGRRRCVWS
jgi:hypothetical protein